jgi:serine/threonine protein phosphatase PrpC
MPTRVHGAAQTRRDIEWACLSDVGCQRENNEDYCSFWEPENDQEFARKGRLAIVADGMGGHEGGQEASRIAAETVEEIYAAANEGDAQAWLSAGIDAAHQRILDYAETHPPLQGMGTTCTAVALLGRNLYYAHVGDSRLYLIRSSQITKLTRDHSYVGRLVESGAITAGQAESHPQRHILTGALGAGATVAHDHPDAPVALHKGDVLVLCTDGLWSIVNEEEIKAAIASGPVAACATLVEMAKARGGPDNITVQIIAIK